MLSGAFQTKKRPRQISTEICQGRVIYISRGATLFCGSKKISAPLRNTNIFPATDVCPHVAEYSEIDSFPCALGGPFDHVGSVRLSASRALCASIITVISASSV